ncbi:SDR family NAD(P)-dependent oxidoreductase [uncultured Marinobacter sp.]|uniref:SDR family NAD(P)-dependent oxidoreductase n=1 Tax=uncultured Marinobacter sp. TaxID=187379 RepID=UPI0030D9F2F9
MSNPLDAFSLKGKTVMITGASSGLGAHFARICSQVGARVVIGARRVEKLTALADEIRGEGGEILAVAMDVTDRASVEAAFDEAEKTFGVVDITLNNAGVGGAARALDMTEEEWRNMLSTNLDGVWRVAQCTGQRLSKAGKPGSIINIASILGLRVGKGLSHYATSKAAVVQLTKALALDLARYNIRVNAIAPGYFRTEINDDFFETQAGQDFIRNGVPMRRLGQLDELNGAMLLLASDAGQFMTGSVLAVDGGHLVSPL